MDITPVVPQGRQLITSYGNGGFKVNYEAQEGSLLILPERTLSWPVQLPLQLKDFSPLLNEQGIEIAIIGTGTSIVALSPDIRAAFKAKSISLEVMDTGGACRTYNILMLEERRVAAALIAV